MRGSSRLRLLRESGPWCSGPRSTPRGVIWRCGPRGCGIELSRLGQPGRYLNQISEYDWIDVIDATSIGFDWFELGHSAYGSELLVDLHRVLAGRPVGSPSELNGSQTWTVARPSGSTPSPSAQPVYRIRTRWPLAPVDRWR